MHGMCHSRSNLSSSGDASLAACAVDEVEGVVPIVRNILALIFYIALGFLYGNVLAHVIMYFRSHQ